MCKCISLGGIVKPLSDRRRDATVTVLSSGVACHYQLGASSDKLTLKDKQTKTKTSNQHAKCGTMATMNYSCEDLTRMKKQILSIISNYSLKWGVNRGGHYFGLFEAR